MKKIDGFLSRLAQEEWPTARVWKEESDGNGSLERFILERQGEGDILLGNQFKEARAGLGALLTSERSRKKEIDDKEGC